MSPHAEGGAVIVRGLLEGGGFLDWRPSDGATIHIGSDARCQWRMNAAGVAPFHLQLCWYAGRLWMAEIEARESGSRWMMAPLGVAIRLGRTTVTLEATAAYAPAPAATYAAPVPAAHAAAVHAAPRLNPHHTAASVPASWTPANFAPSGSADPDATQILDEDEIRSLPSFATVLGRAEPSRVAVAPAPSAGPALEEMFIVPADQATAPVREPDRLSRFMAAVPLRAVLALVVAGGMTLVVFLPESLHANRNPRPAAAVPARRPPPPEPEIEVRAVKPVLVRSAAEDNAAHDLAAGRLKEALGEYRELQKETPDNPVYRDFADVIERRIKARCAQGGCPEEGK